MTLWAQSLWAQTTGFGDFGDQLISLGGYGLLLILMLTRQLITRGTHDDMKREKDHRFDEMRGELIERSMKWERAAENWRASAEESKRQMEAAVEAALSAENAFRALREAAKSRES